jgi:preprotein translocase subunit YajC
MFISPAFAQGAGGLGGFGGLGGILPLILIFVVFYFLLIRPQQKKVKEHRAMLDALRRGDKVVTNGGIVGQITKIVNETEMDLEIADGVRVRVMRGMVSSVYARTEVADDDKAANEK